MAAKALFLVVFVNLPLLVCHVATLAALGLSPLDWLPALLSRQVFFTIAFVLPVAALAAVTRNLGQVMLAGILVYVMFAAGWTLNQLIRGVWPEWGSLGWIRDCGMALVAATGTAAALILQYSRRKTVLARAVLVGTLVLTILVMTAPRWGGAYTIQRLFSPERIRDSAVRISFDESRAGTRPSRWNTTSGDPQGARLEIPVRLDDVPRGTAVALDQVSVSLKSDRGTWGSGWLAFHALHDLSDGAAWLTVYVDPYFYQASKDAAVQFDGALDLTLSRRLRTSAAFFGRVLVPEIGVCTYETWTGSPQYDCYAPFPRVSFDLVSPGTAPPEQSLRSASYAPFPTSAGFRPLDALGVGIGAGQYPGYSLVLTRPAAHFERGFHVRGLRMSQFKMPQP
jgi:hypothetical protein